MVWKQVTVENIYYIIGISLALVTLSSVPARADGEDFSMDLYDNARSDQRVREFSWTKFRGIVLPRVDPGSLYAKVGLQTGDLIKRWNGKQIAKLDDMTFIDENLHSSKMFTIVIERQGREQIIRHEMK